ncbi:MAG TPA: MFS transporter [Capillimicrobium sp.]|nr:MFS transporter [Capillimicrobium sp.]
MTQTHLPPSSARRLMLAVGALGLGGFTIGTAEFVSMGVLPEIARGMGVGVPHAGRAISAYALGVVVGAPLLAAATARLPRRRVLIALMAAYGAGNLASALVSSFPALLVARFVAGLPHGAFFGIAALVAAQLAPPTRRASAVAGVLLGLSVANVVGVPMATWIGQALGWRASYAAVALLAAATIVAVLRNVPSADGDRRAGVRHELSALRRAQVWLVLAAGAIGGGGMFAVYSYISPILTGRTGVAAAIVPVGLALWGAGMVAASVIGGRLVDRRPVPATFALFAVAAACFALFAVTSASAVPALLTVPMLGLGVAIATALQVRLMDVAGDAQTLAAALNHSAFNVANALGAWLGGAVLAGGLGLTAPMWLAVGLTLGGMGLFGASVALGRRSRVALAARTPATRAYVRG